MVDYGTVVADDVVGYGTVRWGSTEDGKTASPPGVSGNRKSLILAMQYLHNTERDDEEVARE